MITLDDLRRHAVRRSLFTAPDLQGAIDTFGFVQADPIQAPARAQDLVLRHRVPGYRAGDLERHYARLDVEEEFFINYGFVTPAVRALMHPRAASASWPPVRRRRADALLAFVQARGRVHPRDAEAHFQHGRARNYWGGSSNATTMLMEAMHYRGLLSVVGRENGIRIYGVRDGATTARVPGPPTAEIDARLEALADLVVGVYAPVSAATLGMLVRRLRYAVPQWRLRVPRVLGRVRDRLAHARIEGVDWYWPAGEAPAAAGADDAVRLLAPFDPVVWDRRRFEAFWGWPYRFEAYTPASRRQFGYYALPLLWRERVIGWGNVALPPDGSLSVDLGYVRGRAPRDRGFRHALELELARLRAFLGG
ncbi:MAG: crosslink repair DNA glycosylase YcaQ family protein [Vicinamibacterales bacterium]